jgi:hypothetical protein
LAFLRTNRFTGNITFDVTNTAASSRAISLFDTGGVRGRIEVTNGSTLNLLGSTGNFGSHIQLTQSDVVTQGTGRVLMSTKSTNASIPSFVTLTNVNLTGNVDIIGAKNAGNQTSSGRVVFTGTNAITGDESGTGVRIENSVASATPTVSSQAIHGVAIDGSLTTNGKVSIAGVGGDTRAGVNVAATGTLVVAGGTTTLSAPNMRFQGSGVNFESGSLVKANAGTLNIVSPGVVVSQATDIVYNGTTLDASGGGAINVFDSNIAERAADSVRTKGNVNFAAHTKDGSGNLIPGRMTLTGQLHVDTGTATITGTGNFNSAVILQSGSSITTANDANALVKSDSTVVSQSLADLLGTTLTGNVSIGESGVARGEVVMSGTNTLNGSGSTGVGIHGNRV